MPPRAGKRPSTSAATKKKPYHRTSLAEDDGTSANSDRRNPPSRSHEEQKECRKYASRVVDESERLELDFNDPRTDAEEGGDGNVWMERHWDMEGREEEEEVCEDIIDGEYMMEGDTLEEEVVGKEGTGDEHIEDLDGFEREHHDVVKERRKRKEFEVFVGGLDRDATEEDLWKVFNQVGEITEVRLLKNPLTRKNKGFAFLRFATVEQARRAVNELKHPVVNGKQCGVAPSHDSDTLFIGNVCKEWTRENLKDKLAHYGVEKFEDLTLVEDSKNEGMNRGFAFLDFASRADALEACKRLQKRDVVFGTDRTARVAFADTFIEPDDEIMSQVRIVFIDGLPSAWDEDRVKLYLKKFGRIEKVELARNMPAAKRTDFGFITFDTHDAAVSCVDGINNSELGHGDKKVKVRARLSRPRQRGKSNKHARGGYPIGHGVHRGVRASWGSSVSRMDPWMVAVYSGKSTRSRSAYDGGLKSLDPRDRRQTVDLLPERIASRRQFPSSGGSLSHKSPVLSYRKSNLQRVYIGEDDSFSRRSDFSGDHHERHSYKDAYPSRGSGYLESLPRDVSRAVAHRMSPLYDNDSYGRYPERSSSYRDSHTHDYSSLSGSKRTYSAIEERHPRYSEVSVKHSRDHFDYGGSSSRLMYSDEPYDSDSRRLRRSSRSGYDGGRSYTKHSSRMYDIETSTMAYRREISTRDAEGLYSSYRRDHSSQDYLPSRSDLAAVSYPSVYSSRRINSGYSSGRDSGSYY